MKRIRYMGRKRWNSSFVAGFGVSAAGVGLGALIVAQSVLPLLQGRDVTVSPLMLLMELCASLLLLGGGFALLVVGADPFDVPEGDVNTDRTRE